jgi:alanine-glyoxylate transaminase/serine-glyoxylate transaminase/serine-pyruvate transaminase
MPTQPASRSTAISTCHRQIGLGKVKARMVRIGHLGDCNGLTLMAALRGCEMRLRMAEVDLQSGGAEHAPHHLSSHPFEGARNA